MASLYLIDGHNVLYRTFFGVPRLTAPDGTPTNVVLAPSLVTTGSPPTVATTSPAATVSPIDLIP